MKIFVDEDIEERYAQGLYEDYLKEQINQKDKEIERLNNIINELIEQKTDYGYVNILEMRLEQANNIINELEKHVEDSLKLADENETEDTVSYVRDILNKLQELKGDGSNE